MKCIHPITLVSAVVAAALVCSSPVVAQVTASNPFLEHAEVRLPYEELKKLWEAAQAANKPKEEAKLPDPDGALLSARYTVDLSTGSAVMEAEYKVESFAGKWEKIPLLGGMGAGLSVAGVEPADARLVMVDKSLCLLAREPGQVTVKVRFVPAAFSASAELPFLELTPAASAVASLEVKGTPEGRLLKVQAGDGAAKQLLGNVIPLPAKGEGLALYLTDAALEPKPEPPPAPPEPSEWTLQNEVLAEEGEGELSHKVQVHAMASTGSALEATLLLPGNARAVKLEDAEDLAEWKLTRNREGLAEVRVRWKTRDLMERDFKLSYALQQLPLAPVWELKAPTLPQVDRTKSLFMFTMPAGMEFTGPGLQGPVPIKKLSKWVAKETESTEFGTVMGGGSVSVQSRLLPRLETAVAVITKAEYSTRLVSDGSAITEGTVEVSHDTSLPWTFTLPEKSELLRCSLDGHPVRPVARDGGVLEIPLTQSGGKSTVSKISYSYTAAKGKFAAVEGEMSLELPQTPLFIQEIIWSLGVPEAYEITATEGNTENIGDSGDSGDSGDRNIVRLSKKLCRNERPQTQLFYRKRGAE